MTDGHTVNEEGHWQDFGPLAWTSGEPANEAFESPVVALNVIGLRAVGRA